MKLTGKDPSAEVEAIELRRLAALGAADMAVCEELHAPDYQLVTPSGVALSKGEYLGQIAAGTLDYLRFEPLGDVAVRILGPNAAAVRYEAAIEAHFPGGADADRFWHTDIYERRDSRWQVVWSQATRIRR